MHIEIRYLRSPDDPNHFLNETNKYGLNALYIACRNGHLRVVSLLIQKKANPHVKCTLSRGFKETPIEVAVRWNHKECVQYLLDNIKYSNKQLSKLLA